MAIKKLHAVLEENGLFKKTRFQKSKLIIDGSSLVCSLILEMYHDNGQHVKMYLETNQDALKIAERIKLTEPCDGRLFGGNNAHFAEYVGSFFDRLEACQITPIIVFDGTFQKGKLKLKQNRFFGRFNDVFSVLQQNEVPSNAHFIWFYHVAQQVIKQRNLFNFSCFYEADDILVKLAATLKCPILSCDSDFFLYSNLLGGVIQLNGFIRNALNSKPENDTNFPLVSAIVCDMYSIESFLSHKKFVGLSSEMLPLAAPLLGQDQFRYRDADEIVKLIANRTENTSDNKWKHEKVYIVLNWLKEHSINGHSLETVKKEIMNFCDKVMSQDKGNFNSRYNSMQFFKEQIRTFSGSEFTDLPEFFVPEIFECSGNCTLDAFLQKNRSHFNPITGLVAKGKQARFEQRILCGQVHSRQLSIACHQVEFCNVLIEDYKQSTASNQCYFALNQQKGCSFASCVYGLLRQTNENPQSVTVWKRPDDYQLCNDANSNIAVSFIRVYPTTRIGNNNVYYKLPMLKNIPPKSRSQVCQMILETVGIDQFTLSECIASIDNLGQLSANQQTQLCTMMMALVYFSNRSPINPSANATGRAFMHALLVNILLVGQVGPNYFAIQPIILLKSPECVKVYERECALGSFNVFITHLYQSYQSCLSDIHLLADILDLRERELNADEYICALEGTFIHNLTVDLCDSQNSNQRLEQIFGRKIAKIIQALVQIATNNI